MTKVLNLNRSVLALLILVAASICVPAQESVTRRRQVVSSAAPEADITINEQFANSFLDAIFNNLKEPSVTLNRGDQSGQSGCASVAVLKREVGGVRTTVHFDSGRVMAPLAFAGSYYSSLLGCIQFEGSANAIINLEFDRGRQALIGRVRVEEVRLTNVPPLVSGSLLSLAQSAIDVRYNPFTILTLDQLSARVPIAPAGGALRLRAKEIRPEISPGLLHLKIVYEFVGAP
ncbi:MAG TPA: hypothetical protein VGJ55_13470 [Pyrinomonadaceae bacterium]|jgi:hypothetical protein